MSIYTLGGNVMRLAGGGVGVSPPPAASPAYYTGVSVGEWAQVPGLTLAASGVRQDFSGGLGVFAYSGGVIALKGIFNGTTLVSGTFFVVHGGGHGNYGGNEVYAYGPLESDSPLWYRVRSRTVPFPENVAQDGSGNPVSTHTYADLVYDGTGANNRMIRVGVGAMYSNADGSTTMHSFDFGQSDPETNQPWSTLAAASLASADAAALDPTTGRIWYHPQVQNAIAYYDIASNTHTLSQFKSPPWSLQGVAAAMDYSRTIFAVLHGTGIAFFDARNIGNDYYTPTTTGSGPSGVFGLVYDPAGNGRYIAWGGSGKQYFTLTPPATNPYQGGNAWTWASVTPSGGATPDTAEGTGTYGRLAYVETPVIRGVALLNGQSSSTYLLRL